MKSRLTSIFMGLALSLSASTSLAVEVVRWKRLPIAVPLLVGQERVIFIERNVRVGLPASLGDRLRIQSAGGTVYLRANEVIEPTRLHLQDAITGELILLDVVARDAQNGELKLEDIRIIKESPFKANSSIKSLEVRKLDTQSVSRTPIPIVLTRYAAQNLYAPLRTVEPLPGVRRINVAADLQLDLLLPSLPIDAKAIAAWRLDDFWVTAIRLRNQTNTTLNLDPRLLLGSFATATFQHQHLGAKGTSMDTTVVYLTTRGHALAKSLLPNISPVDAALNLPLEKLVSLEEANHEK
ncbi:TIGR03749 family integrating conjugative element protein [Pseudomonas sp. lyk4-TYG-107]|uniref:TIGR03749 family integrating conjugative element protein n=1 Tax=Pseudomonas sp. lyk4-TYG-107 TaxID=3040317 RepID=UPI002552BF2D|nr:TIGR03749 family integrating conjugative element protein [Pseudomonas sp. lyk4-TYG-107]